MGKERKGNVVVVEDEYVREKEKRQGLAPRENGFQSSNGKLVGPGKPGKFARTHARPSRWGRK